MSKNTVVIVQSNYIPWKGYFDLINSSDQFVIYDEVQYTKRDWRNRNKIKSESGVMWLTVPVEVKGKYFQKISETKIADHSWAKSHWSSITHSYARAPYFHMYQKTLAEWYEAAEKMDYLSEVNCLFLTGICGLLGIETTLHQSSSFVLSEGKSERLLNICKELGADRYISGPAAKNYLDETIFQHAQIEVAWSDYSSYPEYEQLYPPFEHYVSILDLLFATGPNCHSFLKSFAPSESTLYE
ncbi:MAG: WbqC family protein [Candidatus Obscuribacterales bacterium]|jgi:hypothetical protein